MVSSGHISFNFFLVNITPCLKLTTWHEKVKQKGWRELNGVSLLAPEPSTRISLYTIRGFLPEVAYFS